MAPSAGPAIAAQVGFEIEELISGPHFEANPGRPVGIANQEPVSQDAVHQVHWRVVQDHEIDTATENSLERVGEVGAESIERSWRLSVEEHGDIRVAVLTRLAAGDAAE